MMPGGAIVKIGDSLIRHMPVVEQLKGQRANRRQQGELMSHRTIVVRFPFIQAVLQCDGWLCQNCNAKPKPYIHFPRFRG